MQQNEEGEFYNPKMFIFLNKKKKKLFKCYDTSLE